MSLFLSLSISLSLSVALSFLLFQLLSNLSLQFICSPLFACFHQLSSVNLSTLATRDFHKNPNPVIMYGFDDTTQVEQPATPMNNTNSSRSQNESESSRHEESTSSPNTTGIPNQSDNDTTFGCNITIPDIFNVPLRARELADDMLQLLKIDSRRTSAFIRSKTCAEDNRISSVTMGAVAVFVIFFAAVSIATPDIRICTMWMIYRHKRFSRSV